MKPFEVILSVKLRAEDVESAKQQADKLAAGLSSKLGPSVCQCVWSIREDEFRKEERMK